ncbi:MAG: hypothetical protein SNJ75_04805 [Gemmataceae bacterium]
MTAATLQRILRQVDDKAVLVSSRILERVLREALQLPGLLWSVPHQKSFVCDRQTLFRHAEQADLDLPPDQPLLPDTVILLVRPEKEQLSNLEKEQVLLTYWRRLFHARVHLAFHTPRDGQPLDERRLRERLAHLGQTTFEEIRQVLIQDRYLTSLADARTTYIEFAAVYLELQYFAPSLLENTFPGITEHEPIRQLLQRDLDAESLFHSTRLPGAPLPKDVPFVRTDESQEAYWNLMHLAHGAANRKNLVKAAILRMKASRIAPGALTLPTRREAENNIGDLATRLAQLCELSELDRKRWNRLLICLLDKADQGVLPVEERVLTALQRACEVHEREIYTIDVVDYLRSLGKKSFYRPLPSQRKVRVVRYLADARSRLEEVRLSDEDRDELGQLMDAAYGHLKHDLQTRFRPVLTTALEDVGLRPTNPVERVAFDKMVREILDRITTHGFLSFGELRDIISRNHLKLPDVADAHQFFRGDALLQLDGRLADLMDGVYRRGEIYTRLLARGTSLLFGTGFGRSLTRLLFLPLVLAWMTVYLLGYGLSFVPARVSQPLHQASLVLMGPVHELGERAKYLDEHPERELPPLPDVPHWAWHVGIVIGLAVVVYCLLEVEAVRHALLRWLWTLGLLMRRLFWDWPLSLIPLEAIRRAFSSWLVQLALRFVLLPAVVLGLLAWTFPEPFARFRLFWLLAYALAVVVVNSSLGRIFLEGIGDLLSRLDVLIRAGLISGLIRFILLVFKRIVDAIEVVFYRIDELLRFTTGDSRFRLILQAVLGILWTPIAAVIRFFMLVLIEPLINPLKLPLTFLFAKVYYAIGPAFGLLPSIQHPPFADTIGMIPAYLIALGIVNLLPSVGGFLGWEMRENWGLYRSNLERRLLPVAVGSHGETVRGLLIPGFHSGTVPSLYAKLRQAERVATRTRNWSQARSFRLELKHVSEALQRFAEREMIALLMQSRDWKGVPVQVGEVVLATNRLLISLCHPNYPLQDLRLEIQHHHERLIARIRQAGWTDLLDAAQRNALETALAGFYKRCEVDLVREQILAALPGKPLALEFGEQAILVRYELLGQPQVYRLDAPTPTKQAELRPLVFAWRPILWEQWVACWKADEQGQGNPGLPGVSDSILGPAKPVAPTSGDAVPVAEQLLSGDWGTLATPAEPVIDQHQGDHRLAHDHEAG